MGWNVITTDATTAQENMLLDRELLDSLEKDSPCTLHFYEWKKKSATYGYFIDPGRYLQLDYAESSGMDLAQRPTGGGIVFHIWDMAFSVLIPARYARSTLENYALINQAVLAAARDFLKTKEALSLTPHDAVAAPEAERFCMGKPTKYDVMLEGKKIAGAAQRQRKNGFLHQGTIALRLPPREELSSLLREQAAVDAILYYTYPLLGAGASEESCRQAKEKLRASLQYHLQKVIP